MKFKPEHTVDFMLARAKEEADGYFELTSGPPSKTPFDTRNHVSVQVVRQHPTARVTLSPARIIWRRATAVVTRQAVIDTLATWRAQAIADTKVKS